MAWSTAYTAALNDTFTAAQWNQNVRDNLNETEVAKATLATKHNYFVATGANAVTSRKSASKYTSGFFFTSSTSYVDVTSSALTVTTGTRAIVWISCGIANDTTNAAGMVSFNVTGASSISTNDDWMIAVDGNNGWSNPYEPYDEHNRRGICKLLSSLTAGSNTFTMRAKVSSGSGRFNNREIVVLPL